MARRRAESWHADVRVGRSERCDNNMEFVHGMLFSASPDPTEPDDSWPADSSAKDSSADVASSGAVPSDSDADSWALPPSPEEAERARVARVNAMALMEGALLPVAFLLGWLAGVDPLASIHWSWAAVGLGLAGAAAMLGLLWGMEQFSPPGYADLRDLVTRALAPLIARSPAWELLALGLIAGIAEELLFRGVIQVWLESVLPWWGAITVSAVLFGLAHAASWTYFVFGVVAGAAFSFMFGFGDDRNLLVPIIAHAVYDAVAFLWLQFEYLQSPPDAGADDRPDD